MKLSFLTLAAGSDHKGYDAMYRSLVRQQGASIDWEWIICVGDSAGEFRLPAEAAADGRVRVIVSGGGQLTRQTTLADAARGDLLVTFHPGEQITPTGAYELALVAELETPGDRTVIFPNFGTPYIAPSDERESLQDANYWHASYDDEFEGLRIQVCEHVIPTPASLAFGFDKMIPMAVPAEFAKHWNDIPVLVASGHLRPSGTNCVSHILPVGFAPIGLRIWDGSRAVGAARSVQVAEDWCRQTKKTKLFVSVLNIAIPGYVRINPTQMKDGTWPSLRGIEDGTVGLVKLDAALEYLRGPTAVQLMQELHRVCAVDSVLQIQVPSTRGQAAFDNPAYQSFWNERTFNAFVSRPHANLAGNKTGRYGLLWQWAGYASEDQKAAELLTIGIGLTPLKEAAAGHDFPFPGVKRI